MADEEGEIPPPPAPPPPETHSEVFPKVPFIRWLIDRPVGNLIAILFVISVTTVYFVTIIGVIIVELVNPGAETSGIVQALIENSKLIVGALLGLMAGKAIRDDETMLK